MRTMLLVCLSTWMPCLWRLDRRLQELRASRASGTCPTRLSYCGIQVGIELCLVTPVCYILHVHQGSSRPFQVYTTQVSSSLDQRSSGKTLAKSAMVGQWLAYEGLLVTAVRGGSLDSPLLTQKKMYRGIYDACTALFPNSLKVLLMDYIRWVSNQEFPSSQAQATIQPDVAD